MRGLGQIGGGAPSSRCWKRRGERKASAIPEEFQQQQELGVFAKKKKKKRKHIESLLLTERLFTADKSSVVTRYVLHLAMENKQCHDWIAWLGCFFA